MYGSPTDPCPLAAYRALAQLVRRRSQGERVAGPQAPDWADPQFVEAITLALPRARGDRAEPVLEVALRDGFGGNALPRHWAWPGTSASAPLSIRLRGVRAERLQLQGAPAVVRASAPRLQGTATCLVRDRLAPDRNYLVTCGHVVAPNSDAQVGDPATIGDSEIAGALVEWQPAIGAQVYRTQIDAALVEVDGPGAVALQRDPAWLPAGIGGEPLLDMAVSLRRRGEPLPGALKVFWSGFVDLAAVTPGFPDYFLADAVGYATASGTIAGDSGAAVWDASERLLGMHIGAVGSSGGANAIYGPIAPVLDWYSVKPYTRADRATLGPAIESRRVAPPVVVSQNDAASHEQGIVARTLWGEARGEGERGMRAVAWVIRHRMTPPRGTAKSAAAVCLARKQFSCWNAADPNRDLLDRIAQAPDAAYVAAFAIADELLAGTLGDDITRGATHYVAASLRQRPDWLIGRTPCAVIGNHEFYKDID